MRLLDRYIFRELFGPLACCLIALQAVVIFFTLLFDEARIQDAQLHFFGSIEYAAAASMEYAPLVLPVSLLLALLWALTHHARYNEITAMRAAGISLWRVCAPYFIVGLGASGIMFGLNELVVPWSTDKAVRMLNHNAVDTSKNRVDNLGIENERGHRTWVINEYRVDTGEMIALNVTWFLPDGSARLLKADRAIQTNGVWTFYNAEVFSNTATSWVPLMQTNVLAMPNFDETPRQIRNDIKMRGNLSFKPNIPLKDILAFLRWHPDLPRAQKSWLLTELHERFATPLTCLVAVLIAIPFGALPGRRNLLFGVAGSIFIFFTYYVLQHVSLAFGSSGACPAWLAAWLPNLFFGALGLILAARIR